MKDPAFFRSLKGRRHGNQFKGQNRNWSTYLQLPHWHSETDWNIAMPMGALSAAVLWLHRV